MNIDIETQIITAAGPIVLVVVPTQEHLRILAHNLRQQYKELVTGSRERLCVEGGKEIQIISANTQAMRGRLVDNLIIDPQVYDMPDIQKIIWALLPCLRRQEGYRFSVSSRCTSANRSSHNALSGEHPRIG